VLYISRCSNDAQGENTNTFVVNSVYCR